jgi:hypothetical protein
MFIIGERVMIAIVQHSAYRRSSHRHKGAARYIIDMVCSGGQNDDFRPLTSTLGGEGHGVQGQIQYVIS